MLDIKIKLNMLKNVQWTVNIYYFETTTYSIYSGKQRFWTTGPHSQIKEFGVLTKVKILHSKLFTMRKITV